MEFFSTLTLKHNQDELKDGLGELSYPILTVATNLLSLSTNMHCQYTV